jgi:hypothetical protein
MRCLVLLSALALLAAGEADPAERLAALGLPRQPVVLASEPGRAEPAAPAPAVLLRFNWVDNRTMVLIEEGAGRVRPAWVVTLQQDSLHQVATAYRARAYRDRTGAVHIDAHQVDRRDGQTGTKADTWFPDSFAFPGGTRILAIDDQEGRQLHAGEIDLVLRPVDGDAYARLAHFVRCLIDGCW